MTEFLLSNVPAGEMVRVFDTFADGWRIARVMPLDPTPAAVGNLNVGWA